MLSLEIDGVAGKILKARRLHMGQGFSVTLREISCHT
jgi:hypothetical protein